MIKFEGFIAFLEYSCLMPHRAYFEIVGSKGSIRVDDFVGG